MAGTAESDAQERVALLVRQIGLGDQQAFAEFYSRMAPGLYGLCVRVLRDPGYAEDALQDAMIEVWRCAPRFDPSTASVRSWAATIAHHRAVDRLRGVEASARREAIAAATDAATAAADVTETVIAQAEYDHVRWALQALSERQRRAVELTYYGGHTQAEVAAILGIPLGTVKTRIRDGLLRLHRLLNRRIGEPDFVPPPAVSPAPVPPPAVPFARPPAEPVTAGGGGRGDGDPALAGTG